MTLSLTVDSPELARALGNALAFIPAAAAPQFQNVYVTVNSPTEVIVIGSDGCAAGMETVPIRDYQGPLTDYVDVLVGKPLAVTLERAVRAAGKDTATLTFRLAGLEYSPMGSEPVETPVVYQSQHMKAYHSLLAIFENAEKRSTAIPGVMCYDPSLLSRFAKVKADKTFGRMADFLFGSCDQDPTLIKIGPTFKGLIMPIDRSVNGENIGEDGLW